MKLLISESIVRPIGSPPDEQQTLNIVRSRLRAICKGRDAIHSNERKVTTFSGVGSPQHAVDFNRIVEPLFNFDYNVVRTVSSPDSVMDEVAINIDVNVYRVLKDNTTVFVLQTYKFGKSASIGFALSMTN